MSRSVDEATGDEGFGGDEGDERTGAALATLLILAGGALFVFPEPVTSAVGAALVLAGVVAYLAEQFL